MGIDMTPPDSAALFLENAGWAGAVVSPVAGDASFRRYFRASKGADKAILMDAPPPHEDPRPFITIAQYLTSHGFDAPHIIAKDLEQGLVLLEDFGENRMREHLDAFPQNESGIYRRAVDVLLRLHEQPPADVPAYDGAAYRREVELLTDWYCPAAGLDVDLESYFKLWDGLLNPVLDAQASPVTVLRDYHAENFMMLPDDRLGLLDFQDALTGHRAYDLVSLLQDARRDVSPDVEQEMLDHYIEKSGASTDFKRHYAVLGAQRNAKIIGIFTRLWKRDGKLRYLDFLPRMWRLLERDLAHPNLTELREWFDVNIPTGVRQSRIDGGQA